MKVDDNKKITQIHVRVDQDTRNKWLAICNTLKGNTQTAVFKKLIYQIHDSILRISNISQYGTEA